jgi:hypothetical protein
MLIAGIITGDIVASQTLVPRVRQKLFSDTNALLKDLKKTWISRYETYRGDSLQCEVKSPELALRTALMIRAYFKSYISEKEMPKVEANRMKEERTKGYFTTDFDVRLSVGIGEVDFVQKNKFANSDGQAFRFSGEALDELKQESHRLSIKTLKPGFDEQMEPSILLLDAIIQKWTQNAAEIILYLLQDKKEDEIAGLLNISQSAVNQRKKNAQWFAIEKLIQFFEKTVQSWSS